MDMRSLLKAAFIVPAIEPEWQSALLRQLDFEPSGVADRPSARQTAAAGTQAVSVDMGQGSREQQYRRQRPLLRIVTRS